MLKSGLLQKCGAKKRMPEISAGHPLIQSACLARAVFIWRTAMSESVIATVLKFELMEFPAGTVAAALVFTLTSTDPAVAPLTLSAAPDAGQVVFQDVPAGVWTGSVKLVDASGNALGPEVSDPNPRVIVDAPATVSLQVPASLQLS